MPPRRMPRLAAHHPHPVDANLKRPTVEPGDLSLKITACGASDASDAPCAENCRSARQRSSEFAAGAFPANAVHVM